MHFCKLFYPLKRVPKAFTSFIYHTTTEELVRLNKLKAPDHLTIGQKLLLMRYRIYVIKQGDSLSKLSQSYLGDASRYHEIMVLNQLSSEDVLVGQIIRLPVT